MHLGALLVPEHGSNPRSIACQSRALEMIGFESVWSKQARCGFINILICRPMKFIEE